MTVETFSPRQLTPDQCRTLNEPELAVAVALWILGDDLTANTDVRLAHAIGHRLMYGHSAYQHYGAYVVYRDIADQDWKVLAKWGREDVDHPSPFLSHVSAAKWVWDNRHGQPWQADLEAHVAAWRAEPPELTNDLAVSMFDEGMPLEWDDDFIPATVHKPGKVIVYNLARWKWNVLNQELAFDVLSTGHSYDDAVLIAALVRAVRGEWKRSEGGTE